jgi:hypothetical protein
MGLVYHHHEDKASLSRLAQPYGVGEKQTNTAHAQGVYDRDKLVRFQTQATGLYGKQGHQGRAPAPAKKPDDRRASAGVALLGLAAPRGGSAQ